MANYIYGYSSKELPELPEWDKEKYPYAILIHQMMGQGFLIVSVSPWVGTGNDFGQINTIYGEETVNNSDRSTYWFGTNDYPDSFGPEEPLWSGTLSRCGQFIDTNGDGVPDTGVNSAFWSNHDIIGADGSVLLAASDPVPVEPEQPEEPETPNTPNGTFYLRSGDQWIKQDVYKRVNGAWIKQDTKEI